MFSKKRSDEIKEQKTKLWTKSFIILIFGSFVSMAGTDAIDTVLGLLMLDVTGGSGLSYSALLAIGSVTGILIPISIGVYAEKWSKTKAIYTMDFISAIVLLIMAAICKLELMSEGVILFAAFVLESINTVYGLVYDSFFPSAVGKEVLSKAYSVNSVVADCAEVASLIGTLGYEYFGAFPVLIFASVCFMTAAYFETKIRVDQPSPAKKDKTEHSLKAIFAGYKEVWQYIRNTVGFTEIMLLYMLDCFRTGAMLSMLLPFFELIYPGHHLFGFSIDQEDVFIIILAFYSIGQFWGGIINYFMDIKPKYRFITLIAVSIGETVTMGIAAFFEVGGTITFVFISGIFAVLSYCAYETAIYEKVPADMRARFAGFLSTFAAVVSIAGNFVGGWIIDYSSQPEWGFIRTAVPQITIMLVLIFLFRSRFRTFFSETSEKI